MCYLLDSCFCFIKNFSADQFLGWNILMQMFNNNGI